MTQKDEIMDFKLAVMSLLIAVIVGLSMCSPVEAHSDSYFYTGLGLGKHGNAFNASNPWNDGGGTGGDLFMGWAIRLDSEHFGSDTSQLWIDIAITHHSQLEVGPPWNHDDENSMDEFMFKLEWRWY